jgi:hypothetical protein
MAKEKVKSCFIIMPITVPESYYEKYPDGGDHFSNILNNLFIPAIEKAGFEPHPPTARGSENIQGNIIKNLEKCDLVFCDMSILNPNVFFEWGIRTALNKPVCVVRDNLTSKIPFDNSTIQAHTYSSAPLWTKEKEIDDLIKHINESYNQDDLSNSLWKYFGITSVATPAKSENPLESKMDYIIKYLQSNTGSNNKILNNAIEMELDPSFRNLSADDFIKFLNRIDFSAEIRLHDDIVELYSTNAPTEIQLEAIGKYLLRKGLYPKYFPLVKKRSRFVSA